MIIALTGLSGSGKDEVAQMIFYSLSIGSKVKTYQEWLDYHEKQYAPYGLIRQFSRKLKEICALTLSVDTYKFESQEFKQTNVKDLGLDIDMTVREYLQKVGTECFRNNIDKDFWIKCFAKEMQRFIDWKDTIVITDLRFENEVEYVKSIGATIIKIDRNSCIRYNHPSETYIDSIKADYLIDNNGTLDDLLESVKHIVKDLNING